MPLIDVSKSIRFGGYPSSITRSGTIEIVLGEAEGAETEFHQRFYDVSRILHSGPHQQVEVTGVARMSMERECVCAHDDVINFSRV